MSSGEHEAVHRDLGVYVLGALGPADRDRLERHLVGCHTCRNELASLAVLPSLLARAAPEAADIPDLPPLEPVVARLAQDRRRDRIRTRVVSAAAAAAALLSVVALLAAMPTGSARPQHGFVADIAGVDATVEERDWGMAVHLRAESLPRRKGYTAVAITSSGHRTQVASWTATTGPVSVEGACYLAAGEVERMEILGAPDEDVVATLRPDDR